MGAARTAVMCVAVVAALAAAGCSGRKSSLLLERSARGPLGEEGAIAQAVDWRLEPADQTLTQDGVEVHVQYMEPNDLEEFFANPAVFGRDAGHNPYFAEHMVFYVKISNRSEEHISIAPQEFVLVDDRGNQYSMIGIDYVEAYAEYRAPFSTVTRGLLREARPGYFGFSVPVGRIIPEKTYGRFSIMKLSSLQSGLLYPGVVHDGLVAFWSPSHKADLLRLFLTNIKTNFDPEDVPRARLKFVFDFTVSKASGR
ncbi:MAG TPA: hypothetical protein VGB20_03675 [bacterium]